MTGEEKLNEFVQAVEDWISCKGIISPKKPNKKLSRVLGFTSDTLKILTAEECLCYAYDLHNYGEYLESVKAKENAILEWADSSIWYIISTVMQNYGTQYTKWQEKYYSAIKENPLAAEILKVKNHAEARVKILSGKADRIQNMANVLTNLSRRR
tara:strand:- start:4271 stop:4735 length:465 start_codon:yes stop_codon:yes gene_type:complete